MSIYFGLGSNLGNRLMNLRDALASLRRLGEVTRCSSVYETPAWGGVSQPNYLNACVSLEGDYEPKRLLSLVKGYERELGRVPSVRWGERKIDIDILLMGDTIMNEEGLSIPHVSMCERLFVLVPLEEILPEGWCHPVSGLTVREMMNELEGEAWPLRVTSLL